jgi:hypothetical protein
MYTSTHATAGTLIVLGTHAITKDTTTAIALGGALAFLSHDPIDRLGERGYGDMATSMRWEGITFWIFAMAAFWSGHWWLYAVGFLAGNGMDIWDKRFGLSIFQPQRFPAGRFFKCHRRKPNIQLTLGQTKLAALLSTVIIVAVSI